MKTAVCRYQYAYFMPYMYPK